MKKIFKVFLFIALVLLPLSAVKAAGPKAAENIYIPKEQLVTGNFYAAGQSIVIDGNISGDLIVAAQSITVNGQVDGDIIAAGQDITLNGPVGGNIRVAGNSVNINSIVARNVNAFGANVVLGPNSHVGWDVYAAAPNLAIRGVIDGGLSGYGAQAVITGKIAKSVDLKLDGGNENQKLTIASGAVIGGEVKYRSNAAADISNAASVSGAVTQSIPEIKKVDIFWPWVGMKLFAIFSALLVGLLMALVHKKGLKKTFTLMEKKTTRAILIGLLIFFVVPPASLLLMCTIVGIPLAVVVLALWFVAIYIGKIAAAIFLGHLTIKKLFKKENPSLIWSLVPGVIICWLIFSIPFVGWLLGLIAIWLGLGGIWLYATNKS